MTSSSRIRLHEDFLVRQCPRGLFALAADGRKNPPLDQRPHQGHSARSVQRAGQARAAEARAAGLLVAAHHPGRPPGLSGVRKRPRQKTGNHPVPISLLSAGTENQKSGAMAGLLLLPSLAAALRGALLSRRTASRSVNASAILRWQ